MFKKKKLLSESNLHSPISSSTLANEYHNFSKEKQQPDSLEVFKRITQEKILHAKPLSTYPSLTDSVPETSTPSPRSHQSNECDCEQGRSKGLYLCSRGLHCYSCCTDKQLASYKLFEATSTEIREMIEKKKQAPKVTVNLQKQYAPIRYYYEKQLALKTGPAPIVPECMRTTLPRLESAAQLHRSDVDCSLDIDQQITEILKKVAQQVDPKFHRKNNKVYFNQDITNPHTLTTKTITTPWKYIITRDGQQHHDAIDHMCLANNTPCRGKTQVLPTPKLQSPSSSGDSDIGKPPCQPFQRKPSEQARQQRTTDSSLSLLKTSGEERDNDEVCLQLSNDCMADELMALFVAVKDTITTRDTKKTKKSDETIETTTNTSETDTV